MPRPSAAAVIVALAAAPARAALQVATSLTDLASVAQFVGGKHVTAQSLCRGDEDPHFVQPRPSFVPALRDADLFVTTGMDLELWVPTLLDRANNPRVREGGVGYVSVSRGIRLMEVPTTLSRAQGDIHVDGNPHIQGDPINAVIIASNILAGLQRVDVDNAAYYAAREADFEELLGPGIPVPRYTQLRMGAPGGSAGAAPEPTGSTAAGSSRPGSGPSPRDALRSRGAAGR